MGGELPPVAEREGQVLLDDNLMELTNGRPFPLKHRAKVTTVQRGTYVQTKLLTLLRTVAQLFFHKAVQNDTLFLSIVNVVDYSILVGFDENTHEIVVGIIDYMRQVTDVCACDSVRGLRRRRTGTVVALAVMLL
jgi:hypothetical protein